MAGSGVATTAAAKHTQYNAQDVGQWADCLNMTATVAVAMVPADNWAGATTPKRNTLPTGVCVWECHIAPPPPPQKNRSTQGL